MAAFEIMEDLFFIERGYLNANHFVYVSEESVLIDTGYRGDFNDTAKLITELGVDLADISLIINTHCHCDHIGGNKVIQDKSGCDIALHKVGKYFIDTKDDWSIWWRYYSQDGDFFRCTKMLEEEDIVSLGPHYFKVIHTPGHASDGIVLYNPEEKVLISSDSLWEYDVAAITIRVEGSTAVHSLEESLEKLAKLDVNIVYPGHGSPFTDFRGALDRSRIKVKNYLSNSQNIGNDLLKKITIYTMLMKKLIPEDSFFSWLMDTHWFKETIDLYFSSAYKAKYEEIMIDFFHRGIIKRKDGRLYTTVNP